MIATPNPQSATPPRDAQGPACSVGMRASPYTQGACPLVAVQSLRPRIVSLCQGVIEGSALLKDKPPLDSSLLGMLRESIGITEDSPVSVHDAAGRLCQVVTDGRCSKSGVQWSWLEGQAYALPLIEPTPPRWPSDLSRLSLSARSSSRSPAGWSALLSAQLQPCLPCWSSL